MARKGLVGDAVEFVLSLSSEECVWLQATYRFTKALKQNEQLRNYFEDVTLVINTK